MVNPSFRHSGLRFALLMLALSLGMALAACAASPSGLAQSTRPNVASTVAPVVNIIYNIGGDKIDLTGIIPEGTDSHTFEPAPSDAVKLAKADLIFVNGLDLEAPTVKLARANRKTGAEIVELGPMTIKPEEYAYDFSFPKEEGHPNPHVWMNPLFALRYGEIAKETLSKRDPPNANYYQANYDKFAARIKDLDAAIMQSIQSIPAGQRKLLTYHDSFAYFALRYPVTVIGAIQPADFAEPSAQEVAALILQVKREGVPAIFGSEVFPSKVLEQIGHEAKVRYIDTLRDDELPGNHGDRLHSYFGLMIEDVTTMVSALGGDPSPMKQVDPANIPGPDTNVEQKK